MIKQVREGQSSDREDAVGRPQGDPSEGWLTDGQWRYLASRLPGKLAYSTADGLGTRRFVEAVLWLAVTDSTWPELPRGYGNFHAAYQRFIRWARLDMWDYVGTCLAGDPRLPALQHMVRLHNEVRRRRNRAATTKVVERESGAQAHRPASMADRVEQLEARVERAEQLLEDLRPPSRLPGNTPGQGND